MAGIADSIVLKRNWGVIEYAICGNGKMPAKEFVEKLNFKERVRLEALLEQMAERGIIKNKQKFKHLQGKVWEFKSGQHRVLCFQEGRKWILTHGFQKKRDKTPRKEIRRAESIMEQHLERN
jgi:phage-related protein